ncbi:MAG: two-component regulator propeller domain-containing protein [Anaerolineaceae bacterium]|nr:two-component regulator propeller domain-containing protein [Anaerolineaceae bacterium]
MSGFHHLSSMLLVVWLSVFIPLPQTGVKGASAGMAIPSAGDGYNLTQIPGSVRFEPLGVEQGLSQNFVTAVLQDTRGFLWVGTRGGLNQYDGYHFTIYKNDPNNASSLSDTFITTLLAGRDGSIWVGTFNGGLNRFDPITRTFIRFQHVPDQPNSLNHNRIRALLEDRQGIIWIGTEGGGLDAFDPVTQTFTHYPYDPSDPHSLSDNRIRALVEDPDGALWVATDDGLNRIDPPRQTIQRVYLNPGEPAGSNMVSTLYINSSGILWVGTYGSGFARYDSDSASFTRYTSHDLPILNGLTANIMAIFQDAQGKLWLGTKDGMVWFDPVTREMAGYRHDPSDPYSLSNDDIRAVYIDQGGILWVGTYGGGLNKYNPATSVFRHTRHTAADLNSLSDNYVTSFATSPKGELWVGTYRGLDHLDPKTGMFSHYQTQIDRPNTLSADHVLALCLDRAGILWVGTENGGLGRFDPESHIITTFRNNPEDPNSLASDTIRVIYEDRAGMLWIGTQGGGLNSFDRSTATFTQYRYTANLPGSLSDDIVLAIAEDRAGILWIATQNGGLNRLDRSTGKFTVFRNESGNPASLSSDMVTSVLEDHAGTMWIGTQGGLNRYDPRSGGFIHFREKDGLPADMIYGILEDTRGQLWLSTDNGLSRFNPETGIFRNYDMRDGLQSNGFNVGAYHQSAQGEIFFGGVNGFNSFDPSRVKDSAYHPPVVVTSFQKFNHTVQTDLPVNAHLQLSYKDTFIAFEFAVLDFASPEKNQYAYKLEGFDQDWVIADNRHYASYTNLQGGEYIFHVRGTNSAGIWNEDGIAIPISITPPVWETWWFRGIAGLSLLILSAGIYGLRMRSIRTRQRTLERLVQHRTSELQREVEQRKQVEDDLRLSQALYHEIFDNTHQQIFLIDVLPDGQFRLVTTNPAYQSQTGLSPEDFQGKTLEEILPLELNNAVSHHYRECIETGIPIIYEECQPRPIWDQENICIYRTALAPIRDSQRKITRLVGVSTDITEQKRVEATLARQTQEAAIAAERNRLARELHDAVTQTLFSASLIADVLPRIWERNPSQGKQRLAELGELNRGALAEMRTLLWELRPAALVDAELDELLRQLVEAFIGRARVPAQLVLEKNGDLSGLPSEVKLAIYRITQETLNNVAKHANASHVDVRLRVEPGHIAVEICDDGCGFDLNSAPSDHLGMGIMHERAESVGAELILDSRIGAGTRVLIRYRWTCSSQPGNNA